MSLQVTLDGQSEAIVRSQIAQGHVRSPEELVARALAAYSAAKTKRYSIGLSQKTPAEAVADIHKLRVGVTLGSLKVKKLAHEGHKY